MNKQGPVLVIEECECKVDHGIPSSCPQHTLTLNEFAKKVVDHTQGSLDNTTHKQNRRSKARNKILNTIRTRKDEVSISGIWDTQPAVVDTSSEHFVWRPHNLRVLGIDLYPSENRFNGHITTVETGEDEDGNTTFSMDINPSNYHEVRAAWWRRTLYRPAKWLSTCRTMSKQY